MTTHGLDLRDLRNAFGQFATGVTVITARGAGARRAGITANSLTSLSLDPPLLLFCLANGAPSYETFCTAEYFAVHVLGVEQQGLSQRFSRPAEDKFAGLPVDEGPGGVPLLGGCLARFVCTRENAYVEGDHTIFVGRVREYERGEDEPLLFHAGSYRLAAPREAVPGCVARSPAAR